MTLMRNRGNQTLQQIKDLAREGRWQEAKKLVDTLPPTPDNVRLKQKVEKQLYIATGEIPSIAEDSASLNDADLDAALLEMSESVAPARSAKKNRSNSLAPNIGNSVMQFFSALALFWGVITFFTALGYPGRYSLYDASAVQATQVYSEATFLMVQAIALFVFVGVLQLAILVRGSQWLRRNEV